MWLGNGVRKAVEGLVGDGVWRVGFEWGVWTFVVLVFADLMILSNMQLVRPGRSNAREELEVIRMLYYLLCLRYYFRVSSPSQIQTYIST